MSDDPVNCGNAVVGLAMPRDASALPWPSLTRHSTATEGAEDRVRSDRFIHGEESECPLLLESGSCFISGVGRIEGGEGQVCWRKAGKWKGELEAKNCTLDMSESEIEHLHLSGAFTLSSRAR